MYGSFSITGIEMNGIQRRKVGNNDKPFPGCLGRMVNLFDLSTGVPRNKLLTDAPHREGDLYFPSGYQILFKLL